MSSQPPIPGLNIIRSRLPAGVLSHDLLHFFVPDEVYVQQLTTDHGVVAWGGSGVRSASDAFGFRLSVNGEMLAVNGVAVWTIAVEPEGESFKKYAYRRIVGDNGVDACKVMFMTDVLLPGINVAKDVMQAVLPSDCTLDWRSAQRCVSLEKYVQERTGFGKDNLGRRVFNFCTMSLFPSEGKTWEFQFFHFSIQVQQWPSDKYYSSNRSHPALNMNIHDHEIWMHQAEVGKRDAYPFGFILAVDGKARRVTEVQMFELIWENKAWCLDPYVFSNNGAEAYKLIFNSELLRVGDEMRVLDYVMGTVSDRELDPESRTVREMVLGETKVVGEQTEFKSERKGSHFTFCTCSAYAEGMRWRFRLFQFQVDME